MPSARNWKLHRVIVAFLAVEQSNSGAARAGPFVFVNGTQPRQQLHQISARFYVELEQLESIMAERQSKSTVSAAATGIQLRRRHDGVELLHAPAKATAGTRT